MQKDMEIDLILSTISELIDDITDADLIEKLYIFKHEILDLKFGGKNE